MIYFNVRLSLEGDNIKVSRSERKDKTGPLNTYYLNHAVSDSLFAIRTTSSVVVFFRLQDFKLFYSNNNNFGVTDATLDDRLTDMQIIQHGN